jgi:hypothetical protein
MDLNAILAMALTFSFTAWAGVVAYGVKGIRGDLKDIGSDLKAESEKLNEYIVRTESRLAVLEEIIDRLNRLD